MKRIVIALATVGMLGAGLGNGARSAKAQYFGGFGGGFNPYGYRYAMPYGYGGMYPYGYGPYSGMTSFGYRGYGYGGFGYGYASMPQTYNQLGFLAGTVDQLTRQPRRYTSGGFRSRGVRARAGGRRHR